MAATPLARLALALLCVSAIACGDEGAPEQRKTIATQHASRVGSIIKDDLERHTRGLAAGAAKIAPGFVKVEGLQQDQDMRKVLKILRNPKNGVPELIISPMSFMAVVGMDGVAIARDVELPADKMKGMELGKLFPSVRKALAGEASWEVGEFASLEKGGKASVSIVMASPAVYDGKVVGALVLGIPMWRLQQRISKQLIMEEVGSKPGLVLWVYLYRGDELFFHGTPPKLEENLPNTQAKRAAGLAKSPKGYTGEFQQLGFWYGYGVKPLPLLGPDFGALIVRMDPSPVAE
jgi:hypothetical protein